VDLEDKSGRKLKSISDCRMLDGTRYLEVPRQIYEHRMRSRDQIHH